MACSLLDSLPDIDLGTHLPALLPGLLGMLSDSNAEIRSGCTKLLQACGLGAAAPAGLGAGLAVAAAHNAGRARRLGCCSC